jgi:uncharacterized iron-regulated membrane protein
MAHRNWRTFFNVWSRKLHRWATVATALPLLIVVCSGLFLMLKKNIEWVQPPTFQGAEGAHAVSMETILASAITDPNAGVTSWGDIDRLDVRPKDRVVKVQAKNGWEIQVCTVTGNVLGSAIRRSDLIESIHDGSWFGTVAKMGVFLPSAVLVLVLWLTGAWLWFMPYLAKWRKPEQRAKAAA